MSNLKRLRLVAGLTQKDIAKRMDVTNVAVCLWERGETMPAPARVPKLARLLGTSPAALLELLAPSGAQPTPAAA